MLRHLIFLGIILQLLVVVISGDYLYPDVSCHPSYITDREGYGENLIRKVMDVFCNDTSIYLPNECYKTCILMYFNVLELRSPNSELLYHMSDGVETLNELFDDYDVQLKLGQKLYADCGHLITLANENRVLCEDLHEFYNCLEEAWKC